MTAGKTRICLCPEPGCGGWLWTTLHAFTMSCECDACAGRFLVAYVGIIERWDTAPTWLKQFAFDAIANTAHWNKLFQEAKKRRQEKLDRERQIAEECFYDARMREERKKAPKPPLKSVDAVLDAHSKKEREKQRKGAI